MPMQDDQKPLGAFGAPQCRCTGLLYAVIFVMAGIILLGIGAVVAGFMSHELMAMGAGIVLCVIGILMIATGGVLYLIDDRRRRSGSSRPYSYGDAARNEPRRASGSRSNAPNAPPPSRPSTQPQARNEPPPSYHSVARPMAAGAGGQQRSSQGRGARPPPPGPADPRNMNTTSV